MVFDLRYPIRSVMLNVEDLLSSTKQHRAVTGNAKKGSPNISVKAEWSCLPHRQAWSRPQSPVKWESAESGQGWTLQRRSSVERTYRECERPATAGGGGQNQPGCAPTVLWEPPQLHYHQDSSAYRTDPGNKPARPLRRYTSAYVKSASASTQLRTRSLEKIHFYKYWPLNVFMFCITDLIIFLQ